MRPVVEVVVEPGGDGSTQLGGAVPVAKPDELLLERADEALDDGIAGRASDGREGVEEPPARAERRAVGAGVLRAVVGAQLDPVGHVLGRAERGDELRFDGGEHRGPVLILGDLDDGGAIPQSMVGTSAMTPSLRVHTVVRSVAMRRFGSGTMT